MLDMFEDYANATNNPCDAEVDSYDAMVLFTGRADDLVQRGEIFLRMKRVLEIECINNSFYCRRVNRHC